MTVDWIITWEQFEELDRLMTVLRAARGQAQGEITIAPLNLKVEWEPTKVTFKIPQESEGALCLWLL